MNEVLLAVGGSGLAIVWRNETGMAINPRTGEPFRYGLVGSPDIIGFLTTGHFLGMEIKTGNATQTKEQVAFGNAVGRHNGFYFVVRSVDEAKECLSLALKEAKTRMGNQHD